jgi:hypothetical protein
LNLKLKPLSNHCLFNLKLKLKLKLTFARGIQADSFHKLTQQYSSLYPESENITVNLSIISNNQYNDNMGNRNVRQDEALPLIRHMSTINC